MISKGVLGHDLVFRLAEHDADGRLVVGMAKKIIDRLSYLFPDRVARLILVQPSFDD
jgi:hypothetical protein